MQSIYLCVFLHVKDLHKFLGRGCSLPEAEVMAASPVMGSGP